MAKRVYILNGPNLNLLGQRQPGIYGTETLADIEEKCAACAAELGLEARLLQSNHEGQFIDWIQEARTDAAAIAINPAAWSHTSIAIYDALSMFEGPVIEVHLSNIHAREDFRRHSFVSQRADGIIAGCGTDGYAFALKRIAGLLGKAGKK